MSTLLTPSTGTGSAVCFQRTILREINVSFDNKRADILIIVNLCTSLCRYQITMVSVLYTLSLKLIQKTYQCATLSSLAYAAAGTLSRVVVLIISSLGLIMLCNGGFCNRYEVPPIDA